MAEIEIEGATYRLAKLNALTQFHISRRIMPVMASMTGDGELMQKVFRAVSELTDADCDYVIQHCLSDCLRKNEAAWVKIWAAGQLMFDDVSMVTMINLVVETLKANMNDFFTGRRLGSPQAEG